MAKTRLSPDYIEWALKLNGEQAAKEMHKLNEQNKELAKTEQAARQEMARLESEGKKGSKEWQILKKSVKDCTQEINTNKAKLKELDKRLGLNQRSVGNLSKKLSDLRRELRNTSKAVDPVRFKELRKEIVAVEEAYRQAKRANDGFKNSLLSLSGMKQVMSGFFMGIGNSLVGSVMGALRGSVNTIIEFEKQNSKLASILQSTKAGIKDMTDEARRLGATTSYTAAEVTSLQIELAKLGFNKEQIKGMEEAVLRFSLAVDTDLASAASLAGATLRIFGKEATDAESVLATLAIGTTSSALDFSYLATAMSIVGRDTGDIRFSLRGKATIFGGNSGYDGYSKSVRALRAEENGLRNKSQMDREFADEVNKVLSESGGKSVTLRQIKQDLKYIGADEWHHTSKYGNKTDYYSAETIADYYLNKKGKGTDATLRRLDEQERICHHTLPVHG